MVLLLNKDLIPVNSIAVTTQTTDPGPSNDITQNYQPGYTWVNSTNGRTWTCQQNTAGNAQWAIAVVPGVGSDPASMITQFGSSTGTFREEGNFDRQIWATGSFAGGTGANYVLYATTIPGSAFDISGRGLTITAQGSLGANTNVKTISIIYNPTTAVPGSVVGSNGTTIATTSAFTTNGTAGAWSLMANIFKYGIVGSNTQVALHSQSQIGSTITPLTVPSLCGAIESGSILVAVVANCATLATDVNLVFFEANAMN